MKALKALMINGSPNAHGCTFTALSEIDSALRGEGIETEFVQIGRKDVHGCYACGKCEGLGRCVFDDAVNEVARKFEACDGLVIGSPVYYASPNGALLSFLDRLFYSTQFVKTMKVGAAAVSARRAGTTASLDALNKYFSISGMPIASSQYWNMVHGFTPSDVRKDAEGMQVMRILGRNMAFLIKSISFGKEQLGMPATEQRAYTNFIS